MDIARNFDFKGKNANGDKQKIGYFSIIILLLSSFG